VTNTEIYFVGVSLAAIVVGGLDYIVSVVIAFSAATVQHDAFMDRLTAEPPIETLLAFARSDLRVSIGPDYAPSILQGERPRDNHHVPTAGFPIAVDRRDRSVRGPLAR
jgi:hypothetical protein